MAFDQEAKVRFYGSEYRQVLLRLANGRHVAGLGPPGSGKTMAIMMSLLKMSGIEPEDLTFAEFERAFKQGIVNRDYYVVVGNDSLEPEELIGVWAKSSKQECRDCGWRTIVEENKTRKTCPSCESSELTQDDAGVEFRYAGLPLAMMEGKPYFYNELSRAKQRAQDVIIAPTSDGFLEIPQTGETIVAQEGFVVAADMNTSEHDRGVHDFCWALGSRLRKIYFDAPDEEQVEDILKHRFDQPGLVAPIVKVFSQIQSMYYNQDLPRPMIVRGALSWADDFVLQVQEGVDAAQAFITSAEMTWLGDVTENNANYKKQAMSVVNNVARTISISQNQVTQLSEADLNKTYELLHSTLDISRLPREGVHQLCKRYGVAHWSGAWALIDKKIRDSGIEGIGWKFRHTIRCKLAQSTEKGLSQLDEIPESVANDLEPYSHGDVLKFAVPRMPYRLPRKLSEEGITTFRELDNNRELVFDLIEEITNGGSWGERAKEAIQEDLFDNVDVLGNLIEHNVLL